MFARILIALVIAICVVTAKSPVVDLAIEMQADDIEWAAFWQDSYEEYLQNFDELFNSYTFKLAKNGAPMINGKFVKRAA